MGREVERQKVGYRGDVRGDELNTFIMMLYNGGSGSDHARVSNPTKLEI